MTDQIRRLDQKLGRHDHQKLDEYIDSVRDVERRIQKAEQGIIRAGLPRRHAFKIFRAARSAEIEANGILLDQSNHRYSAAWSPLNLA